MMKKSFWGVLAAVLLISNNSFDILLAQADNISLPAPKTQGTVSFEEAIFKRRSVRSFNPEDLDLQQVSQLLWSAQGITERRAGAHLRAAPSAGAIYPVEIYIVKKDGFFHYLPDAHQLKQLGSEDLRTRLAGACLGQTWMSEAALTIVISALPAKIMARYRERGIRYLHMEAGHIAQNIHLQAVVLGLGSVPIGAFQDDEVKNILNLPEDQVPVYIIPVGYIR